MSVLNWPGSTASEKPFPHLRLPNVIPRDVADEALSWLTNKAPWSLRVEDFYVQHEFSLLNVPLGREIESLASEGFVRQVRERLESTFSVDRTLKLVDVNAHRLTPGQVIRLHNDYLDDSETHRLLIQLNSGWTSAQGGLLMLFEGEDVSSVKSVIMPSHGSGFAFEISPRSFHAVTEIRQGERFTLVYTFA